MPRPVSRWVRWWLGGSAARPAGPARQPGPIAVQRLSRLAARGGVPFGVTPPPGACWEHFFTADNTTGSGDRSAWSGDDGVPDHSVSRPPPRLSLGPPTLSSVAHRALRVMAQESRPPRTVRQWGGDDGARHIDRKARGSPIHNGDRCQAAGHQLLEPGPQQLRLPFQGLCEPSPGIVGALLQLVATLASVGVAISLYRVMRRHDEGDPECALHIRFAVTEILAFGAALAKGYRQSRRRRGSPTLRVRRRRAGRHRDTGLDRGKRRTEPAQYRSSSRGMRRTQHRREGTDHELG